jgi:hypothetical protein
VFIRRSRVLINGDVNQNFTYLVQVDNPNFGKFGNFTGRAIIQDAWFGWAPTGITGGTVIYIDAGLLLMPISHHLLESTTNFIAADVVADPFRFPGSGFPAFRDTGIQVRGWAFNKKIGFRGGVFEGVAPVLQPAAAAATATNPACVPGVANTCLNPKRNPAFRGFVNLDIIGSEEGGWLYGAYKWGKDPILSVGFAGNYQSLAARNGLGNLADMRLFATDVYLNLPMTEAAELVAEATLYLNGNGTASANSGTGLSANVGYRFGSIAPYAAYDYFQSSGCNAIDTPGITAAQINACDGANSRNLRAGLNFFFNKNLNHLNIEFGVNHGQASYGPSAIAAAAGYTPLSLDPLVPNGPRRAFNANLRYPAYKSLLLHWNMLF